MALLCPSPALMAAPVRVAACSSISMAQLAGCGTIAITAGALLSPPCRRRSRRQPPSMVTMAQSHHLRAQSYADLRVVHTLAVMPVVGFRSTTAFHGSRGVKTHTRLLTRATLFSNFTAKAKDVLMLAQEETKFLGQYKVDIGVEYKQIILGFLVQVAVYVFVGHFVDEVTRRIGERSQTAENEQTVGAKMPSVEEYGTNLTKLAEEGKLHPVLERENQIEHVIQILSRRVKNNPCLIGEPGVGKTAIAEGLAHLIASGGVPETIGGKMVCSLLRITNSGVDIG